MRIEEPLMFGFLHFKDRSGVRDREIKRRRRREGMRENDIERMAENENNIISKQRNTCSFFILLNLPQ